MLALKLTILAISAVISAAAGLWIYDAVLERAEHVAGAADRGFYAVFMIAVWVCLIGILAMALFEKGPER